MKLTFTLSLLPVVFAWFAAAVFAYPVNQFQSSVELYVRGKFSNFLNKLPFKSKSSTPTLQQKHAQVQKLQEHHEQKITSLTEKHNAKTHLHFDTVGTHSHPAPPAGPRIRPRPMRAVRPLPPIPQAHRAFLELFG
ncbi:hypothetical protein BDZ97DRAFT_1175979 [Flammula alnicola]|nr:hypothetical protein BDZ97DRAFT_1175979 [Flammula alnicola]